jgi:hypothetical protein
MLKISDRTEIYVICPAGIVTGGTELLHQLVDILRRFNKDAYIVYYGNKDHVVPSDYKKYTVKVRDNINDNYENVLVVCETIFDKIVQYKYIQKVFWWLSVDNFYYNSMSYLNIFDLFKFSFGMGFVEWKKRMKNIVKEIVLGGKKETRNNFSLSSLRKQKVINAYQSAYARFFLLRNHFKTVEPLTDYIDGDFFLQDHQINKESIVVYNPKKGLEFTQKIIKKNPEIIFIPIQDMTRKQVSYLLQKAKVYIDFGNHPGKDRLPREAALSGCIVVTGRNGSAGFWDDVPLSACYKIHKKISNLKKISELIVDCLENYSKRKESMSCYISQILNEKVNFENEVKKIFGIASVIKKTAYEECHRVS